MSNMSKDIQYAGSDTRPPMLDRTDFESWQQRPERSRVFIDLSAEEKERYKADIRATNILLQGITKDIYTLINHYTDAKDIWNNVKMILEGFELTKDDRESQLYDEFEHFRQIKGETIHVYYVRFTKLINDMRNIKMTMPRMQLNSKFVNNMLPEWSRFITEVKLNRGLKESNFDQLYAYLKQHEVHASENRMMMERFIQPTNDPLALVSNASVQQYPTQSSMSPQSSNEPSPADNFQLDSGSSSTKNLIESLTNTLALLNQSFKAHLPQTNNQLRTSSNARNKDTVQDGRVVVQDVRGRYNANNQGRPFQRNNARGVGGTGNVGARECPQPKRPQDSDYFKDKMLLMHAHENGAVLDEEQLLFIAGEQVTNFDDDVDDLALNVDHVFEADQCDAFDSDVDEATYILRPDSWSITQSEEAGAPYDSKIPLSHVQSIARPVVHDSEDTRDMAEITRKRMMEKMKSPLCVENKVRIAPPDYSKENLLATFAPQRNLTPEQIFWSIDENDRKKAETSVPKPLSALTVYPPNTPVKLVPRVLPTKSQVKINLYKKRILIANCLSNQLLYDVEKSRCLDLEAEMSKVHNESKHISKLEREYLNLQLKYQHLQESFDNNKSQTSQEAPDFNSFFKIKNLEHQIQEKDNVIRDLKVLVSNVNDRSCEPYNANDVTDLLEQNVGLEDRNRKLKASLKSKVSCVTSDSVKPKVLAPGMYAIDVKPIPHPLENNRSAHLTYINHLKESVETVREIVEEARVAPYTPVTRKKQVTFNDKPGTSSSNTQKHEVHQKVQQTNVPVIHSTGVNTSTEASGSKPRSNTKKNRILPAKRQFCDSDLEVAFKKHSCFGRNMDGVELLKGWRNINLYTIYVDEMLRSSPICLLSKATKKQIMLWHRRKRTASQRQRVNNSATISVDTTASADVPSSVTKTTDTTSTLQPPPPPLQKPTVHRDICYKDGKVRSKCENKGIVPTEMELALEYTQQGASHEVSVSTEGVEE
ncbi:hypothetical protein Tco_0491842 [Tanacetum coccineum]